MREVVLAADVKQVCLRILVQCFVEDVFVCVGVDDFGAVACDLRMYEFELLDQGQDRRVDSSCCEGEGDAQLNGFLDGLRNERIDFSGEVAKRSIDVGEDHLDGA